MGKKITLCAMGFVSALALAAPASAAEFLFNFSGNSFSWTNGNSIIATSNVVDGEQVSARLTAFTAVEGRGGWTIHEAALNRYADGLGVSNWLLDEHSIDNKGSYDFVLFQFDRDVVVSGAKLVPFTIGKSKDNDSTTGVGNSETPWNSDLNITSFAAFDSLWNNDGNGSRPYFVDFGNSTAGNLFFVGASQADFIDVTPGSKKKNPFDPDYDGFKISSLAVSTLPPAPIPEPATWGMMIAGFGMVGSMMRRRNAKVSVVYA